MLLILPQIDGLLATSHSPMTTTGYSALGNAARTMSTLKSNAFWAQQRTGSAVHNEINPLNSSRPSNPNIRRQTVRTNPIYSQSEPLPLVASESVLVASVVNGNSRSDRSNSENFGQGSRDSTDRRKMLEVQRSRRVSEKPRRVCSGVV